MSTEEFISAIKSREIIWNINHRSFNNRQQKQILWEEIADQFSLPVEDCKKKWKGLRTTLRQSLKTLDRDLPPGRIGPRWKHIEDMNFLAPLMKTKSFYANDKMLDEWSISDMEASPSDPIAHSNNQRKSTTKGNPITQLIDEVRQQQILWNEDDPNFDCGELKDEAWNEIESRLAISANCCKRKWERLTDYLARECEKHPDNRSSWVYFRQLDFVEPFIRQSNRNTNVEQNRSFKTTTEFPERVIAEVRKYPLIWNLYNKNYKSVYKKLKAWRKIAHTLESTVEEVKKKWKALRDIFAKHYAKNPDEKTNNWQYFQQMIFLAPYLKGNKLSFAKSFEQTRESDDEDSISSVGWESDHNETTVQTTAREEPNFSNEDFIEAVRKQQILWDSTFNNFKNNKLRCVVWKEVADYFGLSVVDCKKKWRTLRDLFVRNHLKPIKEEDKTWKHYHQLKFLVPHLRERKNDPLDSQRNSFDNSVEDLKIEPKTNSISTAEETQNDEEKTAQVLDESNIDKFINLVKRHEVLWNLNNKNYRNNEFRFQAWEEISEHFSMSTIDDCRKRWKALRDNFSRHYYKPIREEDKSWKNYHELKFLIPHLKYKKCANVLENLPKDTDLKEKPEEPINYAIHIKKEEPEEQIMEDESMSSDFEETSKNDILSKTADKICSEEFIDLVKQHEMLWNTEDENYRNNELRTKEWEQIAAHFDTSVDECKKKWKALRDSFVRNYFKPIKEKYKSWNYYAKMKFLGPHVKYKKDKSLIGDPEFPRRDDSLSSPLEDETQLCPKKFTVKEFVNEIKKHTILWDLSDERCRMKKYRLQAWKEISAHFSVSTLECKRKWATLRSAFIREFAKCPDNDTWGNFKELDFLLPYLKANVSANNELSASDSAFITKDNLISPDSNEINSDNQYMPISQDENWMEVFIQTVKQQKILWDTTDNNYKNALKRQQAWNSIAKDFGLSIDDSKQKWRSLRDTFASVYLNSQDGVEEISEWKYYNAMTFLCPHLKQKKLGEFGYEENNDSDSCSGQAGKLRIQETTANEKSTIKFIQAVKEKQLLWNWAEDDYKDTIKKEEAWGQIANKFGLPIIRCKERWLAMQNSYNRVILSQSSNKTHSWKYLEEMNFLRPFIDVNADSSNFVDVSGSLNFDDIIEDYSFPEQPMDSKDDDQDDALYEELFECSPSEFSQNIEKTVIPKHETTERFAAKRRRQSESESSDDEDKEFFQYLKETMKQLPSDIKSDAKGHIKAYLKVIASNHNLWNINLD